MNPSTAFVRVFLDELCRCGVREVVLAPGSRNAPLAFALHDADRAGRLRLHVRIDERTAGFLALGLAKVSKRTVPVVCTSGTAAANLHPAVLEADHAGVPLLALTADRPAELRDTGANQTTDQIKLFGSAVRFFHDVSAPEERSGQNSMWRSLAVRAVTSARGVRDRDPGPVHLNLAFREPLVPELGGDWPEPLLGRPDGAPWARVERLGPERLAWLEAGPRTVVVAGDGADAQARWLAESAGWPLLAEPSSGARSGANALGPYRLLLESGGHPLVRDIERVVVYGRPTLSRPVQRLIAREDVEVVAVQRTGRWTDPTGRVSRVGPPLALEGTQDGAGRAEPDDWLKSWLEADDLARRAVDAVLSGERDWTGPTLAREVVAGVPEGGMLFLGSSNAIRDVDLAGAPWSNRLLDDDGRINLREHRRVLANRGLAGIDGTLSTAIGAALAHRTGPAYALLGDLTFLHDANALIRGPYEARPNLTVVVVNDDGGGIFCTLEQGEAGYSGAFERIFGTPHGVDLAGLAGASGTPFVTVETIGDLRAALSPVRGLRIVEARVDRSQTRELHERLRQAVAAAIG